jgi:glycerate 2-kinase
LSRRANLAALFPELLPGLDPAAAVQRALGRAGDRLLLPDGDRVDLKAVRRAFVIAFGKAARPMAQAALEVLAGTEVRGLCAPPAPDADPLPPLQVLPGGHPLPDPGSVRAAERALAVLGNAGARDLVLVLVSGGGSAILERPLLPEIALRDLRALHGMLISCGAGIREVNAVRKHFSGVKGGRLGLRAGLARQLTLYVSDVPPGDPSAVASGPSLPDPSTWDDAISVLERHGLTDRLPDALAALLRQRARGLRLPETPKPGAPAFARSQACCLLDSDAALDLLRQRCEARGWRCTVDPSADERPVAEAAATLLARLREARTAAAPAAVLSAGELACALPIPHGRGGRNQQFALECALRIQGEDIAVLSAGTDGIDGNSPAAGAVADGTTVARAKALGRDAARSLRAFDSFPLFEALGDAVITGPTGTNVRDLRVLVAG